MKIQNPKKIRRRRPNTIVVAPPNLDERARLFVLLNSKAQPEIGMKFIAEYRTFYERFVDEECTLKYTLTLYKPWLLKVPVFKLLKASLCKDLGYVKFPPSLFPHIINLFERNRLWDTNFTNTRDVLFQIHYIFNNELHNMDSRKFTYMNELLNVLADSREPRRSIPIEFTRLLLIRIHPSSYSNMSLDLMQTLLFIYETKPELLANFMPGQLIAETPMLLVSRIFGDYGIPLCVLCYLVQWLCYMPPSAREQQWLKEIIAGKSIRELSNNDIKITKKAVAFMANYVPQSPLTLTKIFITSHLVASGIEMKYAEELSKIRWFKEQTGFFLSITPILFARLNNDFHEFQIIADYLGDLSDADKRLFDANTIDLANLSNLVRYWNRFIRWGYWYNSKLEAKSSGIAPKYFKAKDGTDLHLYELKTCFEFFLEGKLQRHCVFSYFSAAVKGNCHIFSLRKVSGNKPILTIEVGQKYIIQVRGKGNRLPTVEEKNLIRTWALQNNLHYQPI